MASENAKKVAHEVLETVRKGKRVNKGDIIERNGYSKTTATVPSQVTNTKSYQSVINPFLKKLEKERDRILMEISIKDLDKERHSDLVRSLDTITKNVQLLSGKETERAGVNIKIINYGGNGTA